ncbi:MAG: hypothetical protein AAB443_02515 [Patescibacteria group bacterium]
MTTAIRRFNWMIALWVFSTALLLVIGYVIRDEPNIGRLVIGALGALAPFLLSTANDMDTRRKGFSGKTLKAKVEWAFEFACELYLTNYYAGLRRYSDIQTFLGRICIGLGIVTTLLGAIGV